MDWQGDSLQYSAMKPVNFRFSASFALMAVLAACVPQAAPPPVVVPSPAPTPTSAPAPVIVEPVYQNWLDAPQTPGDWSWRSEGADSIAEFKSPQGSLILQIACASRRQVFVSLVGAAAGLMTIRTETATRAKPANLNGIFARAQFDPRDPLLDAMAITKGRFAVETEGVPTLYLPAWAEVTRVIEDCR